MQEGGGGWYGPSQVPRIQVTPTLVRGVSDLGGPNFYAGTLYLCIRLLIRVFKYLFIYLFVHSFMHVFLY